MKAETPGKVSMGGKGAWFLLAALAVVAAIMFGMGYFQPMPMPAKYGDGVGRSFCFELAQVAQHRSSQWLWAGVAIIALGLGTTAGGAFIGPGASGDLSVTGRLKENRNAILAFAGALLLAIGWGWIQRSDAATTLAAEATATLAGDTDRSMYKECILERSRWLLGRAEHAWLDNVPGASSAHGASPPSPSNSAP